MGHSGHSHGHSHSHAPDPRVVAGSSRRRRALTLALALTAGFMLAEVVGGLLTGSLALLADAGHMLSDALSLGVALFAVRLATRPPTPERTFGLGRAEILAALFNGVTLVAVSVFIFVEAVDRLSDPPEVIGGPMLVVALVGLVVNVAAFRILHAGAGEDDLNMSAAVRHVVADMLGSVGVLIAAAIILTTGFEAADPIVSIVIGLLILGSALPVLRDSLRILLEGSPRGLSVSEVGRAMASTPGVEEVHDLHVWTITSGFPALSAHVVVGRDDDCHAKRREVEHLLHERFGIDHTTLQVDHEGPELLQVEGVGEP
ncbi:cation transporter [Thermoleophilia bacterium SCSIO 60948]|nr:cation transporter [Thermoleophilia bacterium SCSIO 60948]